MNKTVLHIAALIVALILGAGLFGLYFKNSKELVGICEEVEVIDALLHTTMRTANNNRPILADKFCIESYRLGLFHHKLISTEEVGRKSGQVTCLATVDMENSGLWQGSNNIPIRLTLEHGKETQVIIIFESLRTCSN